MLREAVEVEGSRGDAINDGMRISKSSYDAGNDERLEIGCFGGAEELVKRLVYVVIDSAPGCANTKLLIFVHGAVCSR